MAQTRLRSEQIEDTLSQDFETEGWNTPTLLNSWANYGGSFETARYMKDSLGVVHLAGLIDSGSAGTIAFTLPTGYRPSGVVIQSTSDNSADVAGEIRIGTNGNVLINVFSGWVSLSNISFMT